MRRGPIDPAALFAFGKSIMAGEDIRRHSSRQEFTRYRFQHQIASGASRERNLARVETEAPHSLAYLIPDSVALDEKDVSRGAQAFVARHQHPGVGARYFQQFGAG
jgi:hypothetical protein